jgi:hypothetical protein
MPTANRQFIPNFISAPMARFRNGQDFGKADISLDFGRFWAVRGSPCNTKK